VGAGVGAGASLGDVYTMPYFFVLLPSIAGTDWVSDPCLRSTSASEPDPGTDVFVKLAAII
jgi:hypothetical protein